MIKLVDVLKEITESPLERFKRDIKRDALSWDKNRKRIALKIAGAEKVAKELFKTSYSKLEFKDKEKSLESGMEKITDIDTTINQLEALLAATPKTSWADRYYISGLIKLLKP
jgi:hypothetical protein